MTSQGNNEDLKTVLAKKGIKTTNKTNSKSESNQPMTSTGGKVRISNEGNPNSWSSYSNIG